MSSLTIGRHLKRGSMGTSWSLYSHSKSAISAQAGRPHWRTVSVMANLPYRAEAERLERNRGRGMGRVHRALQLYIVVAQ